MLSFRNDYSEGCLPFILEALVKSNEYQTIGYGEDEYTKSAENQIREKLGANDAYVRLLVGGTQTNLLAISHVLRQYQAVISANSGHINMHEAGAIEATGHKVVEVFTKGDGKLSIEGIKEAYELHNSDEHMVETKMVYISNPTELGTVYTKKEIESIYSFCKENGLYLFIDGARLASALASPGNDMALEDYKNCCDLFYIGGTKCGLLFGEALVIFNKELQIGFFRSAKQKGAVLAKGRLLGIQFLELFKDNRYYEVGAHSNKMALKLKKGVLALGYRLFVDSYTNQQFFIFPNEKIEKLKDKCRFEFWCKVDENNSAIRFVTSWATKEEDVDKLIEELKKL